MKLLILLQPDTDSLSSIQQEFAPSEKLIVGSIFATPFDLLDQLKRAGYSVEHLIVDTEDRYSRARALLDEFYTAGHTIFRSVVPSANHRWYWLTRAACKPGGPFMFSGDLFVAIYCLLFEKDLLESGQEIDKCLIMGTSHYFPYIKWIVPTRWAECHTSYKDFQKRLDSPKKGIVRRVAWSLICSIFSWKRRVAPNKRGSICFVVGNYFKDGSAPKQDYYFDPIPQALRCRDIPVQTVASQALVAYPDPQADIDILLRPSLSDLFWVIAMVWRVYRRLWYVKGRDTLGAEMPDWLAGDGAFRILFKHRWLMFPRSLLVYRGFGRFVCQEQPSVICFYHENMPPLRALQMAINDLPVNFPRPSTIGFQHGWIPKTRSSHRYSTDPNERENPFPVADCYLVYNEIARKVFSELSNDLRCEQLKIFGFHRTGIPEPDLVQGYKQRLSPYRLRVLFIGGDNEGTYVLQSTLERLVTKEGIALVIRPHPDPFNPFPETVAQALTRAVHPRAHLWIPQFSDLDSLIAACDLVLILPTTTVFLNVIRAGKPLIICKFDDRLDWYGLTKWLTQTKDIRVARSEDELCNMVDKMMATSTGCRHNAFEKSLCKDEGRPPWFGKEAEEQIIQAILDTRTRAITVGTSVVS